MKVNIFVPIERVNPYEAELHTLIIEDSRREIICKKLVSGFDAHAIKELQADYERLSKSKEPYSALARTFFVVYFDQASHFFRNIFLPNASANHPSFKKLKNQREKVRAIAIILFKFLVDCVTLPSRGCTLIGCAIYFKCYRSEKEHEIVKIIRSFSKANLALKEGKVRLRIVMENFPHIQAGFINGRLTYNLGDKRGKIEEKSSTVYTKRPFCRDFEPSMSRLTSYKRYKKAEALGKISQIFRAFNLVFQQKMIPEIIGAR